MTTLAPQTIDRLQPPPAPAQPRLPVSILGVPLDNVSLQETIDRIETMVASRQPHYLVTANVDFLVQARRDIELRRILFDADLVLCDGTPLVWASKLLGNPLPERVAGADLVPILIEFAAARQYRLFFLGATPDSAERAVRNLHSRWPDLQIAGHYSPPFNKLLEMDHQEIQKRILQARPDLLFVSFGCPKQEKWLAMHYQSLQVPVAIGVGATIDFLAGHVRRAPLWMRRSGLEWTFRLLQEPRRLFRRYANDLAIFAAALARQYWCLTPTPAQPHPSPAPEITAGDWLELEFPEFLTRHSLTHNPLPSEPILNDNRNLLLIGSGLRHIDSTGLALLIKLDQALRADRRKLIVALPSPPLQRALRFARLPDLVEVFYDLDTARDFLLAASQDLDHVQSGPGQNTISWKGEITAANAGHIWELTQPLLESIAPHDIWTLDLSDVRFIDSTGLSLLIRFKKIAAQSGAQAQFMNLQPPVKNVIRLAQLESFLLTNTTKDQKPNEAPKPVMRET